MRLTIRALGLTLLDVELHETQDDVECDGSGTTTAYPVGFVHEYEQPDEAGLRWAEE